MKDDAAFERHMDAARYISQGARQRCDGMCLISCRVCRMQLGGITTKRYVWYLHLTDADDSYDSLSCGTCKLFVAPAYVFKFLLATATHCFPPTAVRARTDTSKGLDAIPQRRLSALPFLIWCIALKVPQGHRPGGISSDAISQCD